ncbi:3-oxoadipate enol-lactonase 1 [Acrodontium crateriforme]|uniref:3-oxoadipate enol-lactonase 1 n=1 Tax=Acrodontium crateriforme TaxID=150365 RepID=A0AAQ3R5X1_9PEZI|nr:3-oxoadipate enol-lactonase 1 [Acrodontium crateriforme]
MNGPGYLAVAIQLGPQTDESAFHEWYNTEHGPLRLRLPFILTGDRYQAADGQRPEWSAVYDVSDLKWIDQRIYSRLREERSKREKAVMSTFDSLDRKIYSLLSSSGDLKRAGPVTLAETIVFHDEDAGGWDEFFVEEHFPMMSKIPGWLRTRRFRMQVGGLKGMPPQGQIETLAVHEFAEKNGLGGAEHKAANDTPRRAEMLKKVISTETRQWSHHVAFDALEEPPSSIITTDGAELKFQLEGNPADPVVVFINSILTNFSIWDDVAKALTTGIKGKTYRVLRYNPRGYSQQAARSNDTRFDLLADDLEYLLQRVQIASVHAIIGVSMGGVTTLNFALRYPHLVDKFVACDCNIAASPANTTAWADRIALAKADGMSALADITVKRWFTPSNHDSANAHKAQTMVEQANLEGFIQNTAALCNYDLSERVRSMKIPGLLLVGEEDGKLPQAMQKFDIPGSRVEVIPNAGHLPMLENHEAFMQALEGFL